MELKTKIHMPLNFFALVLLGLASCDSDAVAVTSPSSSSGDSSGISKKSEDSGASVPGAIPWNGSVNFGQLTDDRDGKIYRTVIIGRQTWMAENLNYAGADGSLGRCYGDSSANCARYGRLYSWTEAMRGSAPSATSPTGARGICPTGWHVPSDAEWKMLQITTNDTDAGFRLKSAAGWANDSSDRWSHFINDNSLATNPGWSIDSNGTDNYGFRALPAGLYLSKISPGFWFGNYIADWWSATEHATNLEYWYRGIKYYTYSEAISWGVASRYSVLIPDYNDELDALSLRCTKDAAWNLFDSTIASLSVTSGALTPEFSAATNGYSVIVENSVSSVTLAAKPSDPNGRVQYAVGAGSYGTSGVINLTEGELTSVSVKATNASGNELVYTVQVYRKATSGGITSMSPGMKRIPAGTFTMGSNTDGDTVHLVTLSSYYMDSTDVTQGQYQKTMGVNPSIYQGCGSDCPVENVTWFDAVLYCNLRSKLAGLDTVYTYTAQTGAYGISTSDLTGIVADLKKNGYRLPTEAQWEYAARGGTTTKFYWGEDTATSTVSKYAWYAINSGDSSHPVARKLPNGYGLYDMAGSVSQWTNDWNSGFASSPVTDPEGPSRGFGKIRRGGFLGGDETFLRVAYRLSDWPDVRSCVGIRCVRPGS